MFLKHDNIYIPAFLYSLQYYWLSTSVFLLSSLILLIIIVIHSKNIISDLFTNERLSVSHKQTLPVIDFNYKMGSILAHISIITFGIAAIIGTSYVYIGNNKTCPYINLSGTALFIIGKTVMYLLFLYRLHIVYKHSAYSYNPKLLIFIASVIIIVCIFGIISIILASDTTLITYPSADYAILCYTIYPQFATITLGIYELIICSIYLFAFIYPLRKISKQTDGASKMSIFRRMGIKLCILTYTAVLSTVIMLVFLTTTGSSLWILIDVIINVICICLTTPYYQYYDQLCCVCIRCCSAQTVMSQTVISHSANNTELESKRESAMEINTA